MTTLSQTVIPQDNIMASSINLINSWRSAWGDLNAPAPVPAVNLIYDLLHAAGLPDGAILMVLGQDAEELVDGTYLPVVCSLCDEPATHLVKLPSGSALACDNHAQEAEDLGLVVIHSQAQPL
jgi:hypothetical protein